MNSSRFPLTTDSNRPAKWEGYGSCRSEIVALRPFSKAVFELGPEFRPETREES